MKAAFALLAVLAIASPLNAYHLPPSGSGELANELQKMQDLIPLAKMVEITKTYAEQDKEFQTAISILKTNELKQLVQDLESNPTSQKLANTVQNLGLDIRSLINDYNNRIGLDPVAPLAVSNLAITGGILGYLKDVAEVIPVLQLQALLQQELQTSKVLQELVATLKLKENEDLYLSIYQNEHFLNLKQQAIQQGIDGLVFQKAFPALSLASSVVSLKLSAKLAHEFMEDVFVLLTSLSRNSKFPVYHLLTTSFDGSADELQMFLVLIPLDKVVAAITRTYAAQDKEFQAVLGIFNLSKLRQLIKEAKCNSEFHRLLDILTILGFDIHSLDKDIRRRTKYHQYHQWKP
ncbi:uncharacterized protein LOC143429928 [Xylocopa sonorina]|uniref:uncharacterized protein LOC143429928 n=1 Tax=Xylocopa sonorina TaxID=1818115 RepID=UPI00403B1C0D